MMDDKIIGDQTHAETIHSTKKWVHVTLQKHLEIVLLISLLPALWQAGRRCQQSQSW